MIKINKTASIPNILSTTGIGATETLYLENAYTANPNLYESIVGVPAKNIEKFQFDNNVYGHGTVKAQLKIDQHDKCCFCEAKFSDNSFGDVEHFRPKGAYKRNGNRSLTYPGYYWLAYDWNNLMYSCEVCNRSFKKNQFPLRNETTRKPNHTHANLLTNEDRLLINPNEEDPSTFITFKEEVPVPVNGSLKGSTSIRAYGLERLNNTRLEYINVLSLALIFSKIDPADDAQVNLAMQAFNFTRQEVLDKINSSVQLRDSAAKDTAKFAYCIRCKFPNLPTV